MSKRTDKVVLGKFLHIGDKLICFTDNPNDRIDSKPDGTTGIVIGFYRYRDYIANNNITRDGLLPGIYEGNGVPYCLWSDGTTGNVNCHDVVFADKTLGDIRRDEKEYHKAFETMLWISDLPELPYMEGDTVLMVNRNSAGRAINTYRVVVKGINYLDVDKKYDDGTPYRIYDVYCERDGWSQRIGEAEITEIVSRGNYYWWKHDKSKLKFKDLNEEAGFYRTLGFAKQVRNPKSNNYRWTLDEILEAVANGSVDAISTSGSFFGSVPFPIGYRYPDMPELGKRLREETLKGFEKK